jgi:type VI secretion system secreted protein VgrG
MGTQVRRFTQANRPLAVKVQGLDADALLLVGFRGEEAVSQLFRYRLDLVAENPARIPFEKLLGRSVTVELELPGSRRPRESKRFFNGICRRVTQGERDENFTRFHMDVVPQAWLLTKVTRSRVFQHLSVWEILDQVFEGLKTLVQKQGDLAPRDYCVQYRETDFAFASRLMAEEGISYYFKHDDGAHTLVLRNDPQIRDDLTPATVTYRNEGGDAYSVRRWEKVQELRAGKVTFRDHTFEQPQATLEVSRPILPEILAGAVTHKLNGVSAGLELYDYPGQYAKRFDGINRSGAEQPAEIGKIFPDKERTARIRMEQEATAAVAVNGESNCRQFVAGHTFTLQTDRGTTEEQAQADGVYLLTSVQHRFGQAPPSTSEKGTVFTYENSFSCTPAGLPYRPLRSVPKPVIAGTQTAVVVGPSGEELYVDKYGRVKVQFFWDREAKKDLDSSCWVRVAQVWAGQRWGAHFWPRIGQEVVVAFEEGDPDQPLIVGSVYNAENPPPYDLPDHKTRSGVKSRSTLNGTPQNFNEIRFEDKKGHEEVYLQAERNLTTLVKSCESRYVGGSRTTTVHYGEKHTVDKKGRETVIKEGDEILVVEDGNRQTVIKDGDETHDVADGRRTTTIAENDTLVVQKGEYMRVVDQGDDRLEVHKGIATRSVPNGLYYVFAKTIQLNAAEQITFVVGGSIITITPDMISINAPKLLLNGNQVKISGAKGVKINGEVIDLN